MDRQTQERLVPASPLRASLFNGKTKAASPLIERNNGSPMAMKTKNDRLTKVTVR